MTEPFDGKKCLICQRGAEETPLVVLEYRDWDLRICPQHLPVLIHDPGSLIGILPGAETLRPADRHDQPPGGGRGRP